jgi:hypothetical protein
MQNMERTRIIFIAIIGVAVLVVCGALGVNLISGIFSGDEEPTVVAPIATVDQVEEEQPTPMAELESPEPIFGPNYDPSDGLPTYLCGADAFGSYFTLQQMQMSGK